MANRQNNRRFNHRSHRGNLRQFSRRQNSSVGFRHDSLGYQQQRTLSNFSEFAPYPDQFGIGWGGNFDGQQHIGGYDYADDVPHFRPNQRGRGYSLTKRPLNNQGIIVKKSRKSHNWNNDYGDSSAVQYEDSACGGQSYKDFFQEDEMGRETGYYGDFNDCGENYASGYDDKECMGDYDDMHLEQNKLSWSKQFSGNPIAKLGIHEKRLIREGNQNEKFVYQKHRKLAQNFAGREFLHKVVKSTMHALKIAGDKFTEELKNKEMQKKADKNVVTDLSDGNSQAVGSCRINTANIDIMSLEDTEQKQCKQEDDHKLAANISEKVEKGCPPQVVLGLVRVGSAAKRLLNVDSPSNGSELVMLFKCKPTKLHLETVSQILKKKIAPELMKSLEISINERTECIEIVPTCGEHRYTTIVRLSSPRFSRDLGDYDASDDQDGTLCRSFCSEALAKIRRIRWFQKVVNQELEVPVIRILLDMSTRLSGWDKLAVYSAEVLVHTVAQKLSKDARENEIHASRILIQSLEVLAGGLVLSGGPSLKDPCEKEPVDVFGHLFEQDAEDLTRAAQTALRIIAGGKLDELLGLKDT